ncbi:MAG TPA: CDP-alcohol phosphatidyltransferase family protein [Bryobacteraceae bacterium]|jgi:phosphatidylglycerophosphate synthase
MTPSDPSSKTPFKTADRSNLSFLAAFEKRTLIWIAERLPAWVHSDHLTALGFISLAVAGLLYWSARTNRAALAIAVVFLALNWFGDSLDGTLARVRNRQRPRYGFYVDHVLDALGTFLLMSGLAFSGYMMPAVAYAFLIVYLLLSIEVYLATYTMGTFHLSFWSFGPTELRLLLAVGSLVAIWQPYAIFGSRSFLLFDVGFAIGTLGMTGVLAQAVIRHTTALYKLETK